MKGEEAAWLACAIDGEGSIYPIKNRAAGAVVVYGTNRGFVERAATLMNCAVYVMWKPGRNNGGIIAKRTMFCARTRKGVTVRRILRSVLPYLIIKKEKAVEVLRLMEAA